jgi:hypothetical protein
MAIDKIDWHWDSVTDATTDYEHWERAGAHIGYYLEWAFRRGFANTEIHGSTDEVENIFDSGVNGVQFLIDYCDTKFWDDDLNEEGQRFTSYAYDKYVENFEKITGHKMYTKNYNQQDLQAVSKYLDEIYENYLNNPQQIQAKNESHNAINEKIFSSKLNQIVLITFVLVIFAVMIYGIVLAFTLI